MTFIRPPPPLALVSASYAACRHGGAPPELARIELALSIRTAAQLERMFQARPGGGAGAMKPRFARHRVHVRAVMATGGFPVLARP